MVYFDPVLVDPDGHSIHTKTVIMMLSRKHSRAMLQYIFNISGRLFENVEHCKKHDARAGYPASEMFRDQVADGGDARTATWVDGVIDLQFRMRS